MHTHHLVLLEDTIANWDCSTDIFVVVRIEKGCIVIPMRFAGSDSIKPPFKSSLVRRYIRRVSKTIAGDIIYVKGWFSVRKNKAIDRMRRGPARNDDASQNCVPKGETNDEPLRFLRAMRCFVGRRRRRVGERDFVHPGI